MKLFALKPVIGGQNRIKDFIEDCFVCLYSPGIGDMERGAKEQWFQRLAEQNDFSVVGAEAECGSIDLDKRLADMEMFALTMQDGDFVLVRDGDEVHVGDLGDYYYVDHADALEDGSCHRRGVTWVKSVLYDLLPNELQKLTNEAVPVSQFDKSVTRAQMELWFSGESSRTATVPMPMPEIDAAVIETAISVLTAAMSGEDAERRERAAAALLQYASRMRH